MGFRYCFDPEFGFRGKKLNVQGQVVVKEFHRNQPKSGILTESKNQYRNDTMASIHIVDQYQNYTTCSKPNFSLRITEPKEFRLCSWVFCLLITI